jgi:SAM-dependent methyltransferase
MQREPEPELMAAAEQAAAYAAADFSAPHQFLVDQIHRLLPALPATARVLDLGCGPADVTIRLARAFPTWRIDGVDGAEAMLALGRARVQAAGLEARIALHHAVLPHNPLPGTDYDIIVSNSLLHHLHDAQVLWKTLHAAVAPGAFVYVTDLRRPADAAALHRLIETYCTAEPAVLRRDFEASLRAAFTAAEVRAQLDAAGLPQLAVTELSDRHLAVAGRVK